MERGGRRREEGKLERRTESQRERKDLQDQRSTRPRSKIGCDRKKKKKLGTETPKKGAVFSYQSL